MDGMTSGEELYQSELMREVRALNTIRLRLVYLINLNTREVIFREPYYCFREQRDFAKYEKQIENYYDCTQSERGVLQIEYYRGETYLKLITHLMYKEELYIAEFTEDVTGILHIGYTERSTEKDVQTAIGAMEKLLFEDRVTGLYNSYFIKTQLPEDINAAAEDKVPLTIIMMRINCACALEKQGRMYAEGWMINRLAESLRRNLKEGDWAARENGDQFIISLYGKARKEAVKFVKEVRRETDRYKINVHGKSIGVWYGCRMRTIVDFSKEKDYSTILREMDK